MGKRHLWTTCFAVGLLLGACGGRTMGSGQGRDAGSAGGTGGTAGADTAASEPAASGGVSGQIAASSAAGGSGGSSLVSRVPASGEVEGSVQVNAPTVAASDADLYNQMDGAAPAYIERGWLDSVSASYRVGSLLISVESADMGNPDNALAMFTYEVPVSRMPIEGVPNAVVDTGLLSGYRAIAAVNRCFIRVACEDRSSAALDLVERFTRAAAARCN
jgi:hypothetical protein